MKTNDIKYPNQIPANTNSKESFNKNKPLNIKQKKTMKGNFIRIHNIKKEEIFKNDNKSNIKNILVIIIVIALILLILLIVIIIYFKLIKKDIINEIKPEKPPISPIEIPNDKDIFLNNMYKAPLETPLQNIISGLSYEEIESRINSPIILENNILLNDTINNINDNLILNNFDIEIITNISEIVYSLPDNLINSTKNSLKIFKSDISFYKNKFEELSNYLYNITINSSESLNNIYYLLNGTKKELINLFYQFQENIKNISIPFILEQKEIFKKIAINKNISLSDEMEEYKIEINNLNNLYNQLFSYINTQIQIIFSEINVIKNIYLDLQRNIEDEKEKFIKKLEEFKKYEDNLKYHEILTQIKKSFITTIKEEIKKIKIQFKERMNSFVIQRRNINLEELKKNCDEIIGNINSKIFSIKNLIFGKRMLNSDKSSFDDSKLYASNIISDYINNSLYIIIRKITLMKVETEEGIEVFLSICEVEEKTSLDLLFIMDISNSMKSSLNQAKQNIINIINRLSIENPGINVSVGFIGYIDVYGNTKDYYINIDFTQDHEELKKRMQKVTTASGGEDWPEDMAWGFEMALYKNWKYNARAIVLVADYPCHGTKYHTMDDNFPNGSPNTKNIEKSIEELASKNVSLYCIRLTEHTEQMFKIFSNIYKNYSNCNFMVVNMNNDSEFPEIIINVASKTYIGQRNNG